MDFLDCVRAYAKRESYKDSGFTSLTINIITNFTDDSLERALGGMCLLEELYPSITRAPYKQYAFVLKDPSAAIYTSEPAISFLFFDCNPYLHDELSGGEQLPEVLADIERYCEQIKTTVVISLSPLPFNTPYGHFFADDPLFTHVRNFNQSLEKLSKTHKNVYLFDTNKIIQQLGEMHARDMRGSYAFDMPFTNDFCFALCEEWFACIRAISGKSRKCIILDLDNTLWGGVVGELGPLDIEVGPGYPGVAYQNFQRSLLKLWERGIILAICSKNNIADVKEVFEKNPHMILKEEHFAAIRANWDEKSQNIVDIAKELNIGTHSMIFLDDSPLEREKVRMALPEVLVPEFSLAPEKYVGTLLSLKVFHQMSLTDEDKKKGLMYAQERQRTEVLRKVKSKEEYIAELDIVIKIFEGIENNIPRVAQLTQKTNQYNLTTRRYSEADMLRLIEEGWRVYSAEVSDKFGEYGIVIVALFSLQEDTARLDTFLMSCRVMGRDVEYVFLQELLSRLQKDGFLKVTAEFIHTPKNEPSATFLRDAGLTEMAKSEVAARYEAQLLSYLKAHTGKRGITVQ